MQDIQEALAVFLADWADWCAEVEEYAFAELKPMHVGWKVADESTLGQKVASLLPFTEQGHIGTVDNRKIILLALKKPVETIPILQVMQLRPGSSDPIGLDHVAFYCENIVDLENFFKNSQYTWERQSNPGHAWISLWFGAHNREAKFFDHTSLDIGAQELTEASTKIKN